MLLRQNISFCPYALTYKDLERSGERTQGRDLSKTLFFLYFSVCVRSSGTVLKAVVYLFHKKEREDIKYVHYIPIFNFLY